MKEETSRQESILGGHLQKQEGHRQERSSLVWFAGKDGGGGSRVGEVAEGEEGGVARVREKARSLVCCLVPLIVFGAHTLQCFPE